MRFNRATVNLILLVALIAGCSDSGTPDTAGLRSPGNLRILFTWGGDDFASQQELETRDKIGRLISQKGIGRIVRSGTGMGWMDIVVEVEDKGGARKAIEPLVRDQAPGLRVAIRDGQ